MDKGIEDLQREWKLLFQKTLPEAATSKAPSQSKWPIHADHCFARIILDLTVGVDTPWMNKIKSPAYKNMSKDQLEKSILMGNDILEGKIDLVQLTDKSLALRGKQWCSKKRKNDENENSTSDSSSKRRKPTHSSKGETKPEEGGSPTKDEHDKESPFFRHEPEGIMTKGMNTSISPNPKKSQQVEDLTLYIKKIALSHKTLFQKKVLTALCQVPKGKYTTYGAISNHLSSSPRAVGNALKNNPFAPQVPCHRVLASGGGLGGFKGSWGRRGEAGKNDDKKIKLLRDEGVRFDGSGKVVGAVWDNFT